MMNSWLSEQEIATKLRKALPYTAPQILDRGPIFGMGYRPSWRLGNIVQAQIAKDLGLKVMLAQQSAREIERTKRTFQDVMDSATYAAFLTEFKAPWGADADHLKQEKDIEEAVKAGFTHFTYDVSEELKKDLNQTIAKICDLYFFTQELRGKENFSTEISLDETEETTKLADLTFLLEELKRNKVQVDEIAPRFPGYFEKGIDYYWQKESAQKEHRSPALELTCPGKAVGLHHSSGCGHEQNPGQIRGGLGENSRGVSDENISFGGLRHVDVVITHSIVGKDSGSLSRIHNLGIDFVRKQA
ncbi:tagaturonate epimerase [Candidatus Hakubella thermalkaliphila]|uniref:Tagaturonate epimerase n=1 Tax=Candidatus Hakubella thermalkaliphila TaxID=2754717 RepID=A0A6V8PYD4_9ACTN|nr:tagaturonate epimerase [Candidatus Hakubella thermalkaliphila]